MSDMLVILNMSGITDIPVISGWLKGLMTMITTRRSRRSARADEPIAWISTTAEVVSVLQAGKRSFLLVRYQVGSRLIHNDVMYPLAGVVPTSGHRVPIRYDPTAPARMEFDLERADQLTPA